MATYDKPNKGVAFMRRLVSVLGFIGLGLLLGFVLRLVWPRPSIPVYEPPQ